MKQTVQIRMDKELLKKVDAQARKETRSRANMIEVLIARAMEENKP